jgi:hypothetical protein
MPVVWDTCKYDVNTDGSINLTDLGVVKSLDGTIYVNE